jgi:hypothetical protein
MSSGRPEGIGWHASLPNKGPALRAGGNRTTLTRPCWSGIARQLEHASVHSKIMLGIDAAAEIPIGCVELHTGSAHHGALSLTMNFCGASNTQGAHSARASLPWLLPGYSSSLKRDGPLRPGLACFQQPCSAVAGHYKRVRGSALKTTTARAAQSQSSGCRETRGAAAEQSPTAVVVQDQVCLQILARCQ